MTPRYVDVLDVMNVTLVMSIDIVVKTRPAELAGRFADEEGMRLR